MFAKSLLLDQEKIHFLTGRAQTETKNVAKILSDCTLGVMKFAGLHSSEYYNSTVSYIVKSRHFL